MKYPLFPELKPFLDALEISAEKMSFEQMIDAIFNKEKEIFRLQQEIKLLKYLTVNKSKK